MEFALFALLLLVAAWLITAPLRSTVDEDDRPADLRALESARDAKLREIQEAEFDLRTGKLSAEDHERIDQALRGEALALVQSLDAMRAGETARDGR